MKKILLLTLFISLLPLYSNAQNKETVASRGYIACFGKQMLVDYLNGYLPEEENDCYELNPGAEVVVIEESNEYIQIKPWMFRDIELETIVELWTVKKAIRR